MPPLLQGSQQSIRIATAIAIAALVAVWFIGTWSGSVVDSTHRNAPVRATILAGTHVAKAGPPDERREVDLGELPAGEKMSHCFAIRNTTESPFTLTAIRKSCGCQSLGLSEGKTFAPDSITHVTFSSPAYTPGEHTSHVVLTTDSPNDFFKEIDLSLSASVISKAWSTPSQVLFGTVNRGEQNTVELQVQTLIPRLLTRFKSVHVSRGLVDVTLDERTSDGLHFSVKVMDNCPSGSFFDLISVRFDAPDTPQLNVRVSGRKAGSFTANPAMTMLDNFSQHQTHTRHVTLRSTGRQVFRVTRIECPTNIAFTDLPKTPSDTLDLTFRFTKPAKPRMYDTILIHSEDETLKYFVRYARAETQQ